MWLRRLLIGLVVVMSFAVLTWADTLKMKNGTTIKGKVTKFNNKEFTILIDGSNSRAIISADDIESIEFDGSSPAANVPVNKPPQATNRPTQPTNPNEDNEDSDVTHGNKGSVPNIRSVTVAIPAREDWTSTGLIVTKGQKVRISASGQVDLGSGRKSGPDGIAVDDKDRLMPNYPTGGLIAVIGDDNDNFIFIGKSGEFVAQRSGRLFLSVNEGNLKDNTGTYSARVEVELALGKP